MPSPYKLPTADDTASPIPSLGLSSAILLYCPSLILPVPSIKMNTLSTKLVGCTYGGPVSTVKHTTQAEPGSGRADATEDGLMGWVSGLVSAYSRLCTMYSTNALDARKDGLPLPILNKMASAAAKKVKHFEKAHLDGNVLFFLILITSLLDGRWRLGIPMQQSAARSSAILTPRLAHGQAKRSVRSCVQHVIAVSGSEDSVLIDGSALTCLTNLPRVLNIERPLSMNF
ncbi:hypothetical protein BDY19DRAFT_1051781 [Irpex rosettiformis]|uniref:Uncharacterized protein n=1 Tax=Irpex rosettiformis TaxID=378272 RepID=A0ACB8TNI3_9APHY|nr:hypothetical protein BDY19DRAFT_1051781 [Irpex rosettiformis]